MTAKKRMATHIKNRLAQSNKAKNANQQQQNPMRTSVELVAMDAVNGGTDQVIIHMSQQQVDHILAQLQIPIPEEHMMTLTLPGKIANVVTVPLKLSQPQTKAEPEHKIGRGEIDPPEVTTVAQEAL
jgi:hypothetical protein